MQDINPTNSSMGAPPPLGDLPRLNNHSRAVGDTDRRSFALVTDSAQMKELDSVIARLAGSKAPILISGEVGTGKIRVAKTLHARSLNSKGNFELVRAGEISATGLAEAARRCEGGTLVVLHLEELSDDAQRTLLGILDRVSPRVFATTSVRLEDAAKAGRFRSELLYRIQVLSLRVPALRERPQDLPTLWSQACLAAAKDADKPVPVTTTAALGELRRYDWPGNVRELENVARHAVQCAGTEITERDLPSQLSAAPVVIDTISLPGMRLRDLERIAILRTYEATGSAKATAEMLDISVRKVHYRLKEYRGEQLEGTEPHE